MGSRGAFSRAATRSVRGGVDAWVRVSPGELIDRIGILELKVRRLAAGPPRARVAGELEALRAAYRDACAVAVAASPSILALVARLREVNQALWTAEDEVRRCERAGEFGARFVDLARSIYRDNDERARIKRSINAELGSTLVEEKVFGADPAASEPPTP